MGGSTNVTQNIQDICIKSVNEVLTRTLIDQNTILQSSNENVQIMENITFLPVGPAVSLPRAYGVAVVDRVQTRTP